MTFPNAISSSLKPIRLKKRNIAIIVRVPLASGMLTGKMNANSTFAENDHRAYNINGEAFDIGETFSGARIEQRGKHFGTESSTA